MGLMDVEHKVNGRFFLDIMRDKRLSMRELSAKMGFSHHAQLSRIFKGDRRMQLDEAVKLPELLGVSFDQVIAHAGFPHVVRAGPRIKVVGALNGNGIVEPVRAMERAVAPSCIPNDAVAIQARSADTRLSWMDTWLFFCMEPTGMRESSIGRFCHAKVKDGPQVLATIRRGYTAGTFNLSGPFDMHNAELVWAEPVFFTRN